MSQSTSTVASRRNGTHASCEPCRIGKIRCDHQRPVCGRCQRRGMVSKCYVHPNPLTKSQRSKEVERRTSVTNADPEGLDSVSINFLANNEQSPFTDESGYQSKYIQAVVEILSSLKHYEVIHAAITSYVRTSDVGFCPNPLLFFASSLLLDIAPTYVVSINSQFPQQSIHRATQVLETTSAAISITPDMDYKDLARMFIGENLRLELMGFIFSTTARALTYNSSVPGLPRRQELLHKLHQSSISCLEIAREVTPNVHDVMAWLSYEVLRATTLIKGNLRESCELNVYTTSPNNISDHSVWFQLGDCSSYVLALGAHRESSNTPATPFFIAEMRRKLWTCRFSVRLLFPISKD